MARATVAAYIAASSVVPTRPTNTAGSSGVDLRCSGVRRNGCDRGQRDQPTGYLHALPTSERRDPLCMGTPDGTSEQRV